MRTLTSFRTVYSVMHARALHRDQHLTVLYYDPPLHIAAGPPPAGANSSVGTCIRHWDCWARRAAGIYSFGPFQIDITYHSLTLQCRRSTTHAFTRYWHGLIVVCWLYGGASNLTGTRLLFCMTERISVRPLIRHPIETDLSMCLWA